MNLGLYSGIGYNFTETDDGDEDPNIFFGADIELNPEFSAILMEYNAALNENNMTTETLAINGGYLNAG